MPGPAAASLVPSAEQAMHCNCKIGVLFDAQDTPELVDVTSAPSFESAANLVPSAEEAMDRQSAPSVSFDIQGITGADQGVGELI